MIKLDRHVLAEFHGKMVLNMIKNIFSVNQESATWQSGVEVNQA